MVDLSTRHPSQKGIDKVSLDLPRRLRRLRNSPALRRLTRETLLTPADFILPLFVRAGQGIRQPIKSMPGQNQLSPDEVVREAVAAYNEGIPALLLFGIPETKDAYGSAASAENGVIQQTVRLVKREIPELLIITDVCLCEYTDHGHCGILDENGYVLNDRTVSVLVQEALSHAAAGADMVAPSDMMDGRIGAIRQALDNEGFIDTVVMSYAAKYASGFYGPFREAAESPPSFGDRRSHQMDPANWREALREVELDIAEGADIVMVKPALSYLDVITRVKERFELPTAAYNVSGEYSMVKAAAAQGWIDEKRVTLEILTSIKRAGADMIITYHAREAARWLSESEL